MSKFDQARLWAREQALRASVAVVAAVPLLASAQETDPFVEAMTDATSKVTTYAGALVGLGAVAVIFMIGLKYVKKIPRAS